MARKRRTHYEYDVWTNRGFGWEVEATENTLPEARQRKKEYIENDAGLLDIMIRKRHVKNDSV